MDHEDIRAIIVKFIQQSASPEVIAESIRNYSLIFPGEDADSIRAMVAEDINRELEELKKQITSLLSGDGK